MILTGHFKKAFEEYCRNNGYTMKYFEVLSKDNQEYMIKEFIKLTDINEVEIHKAMNIFNEYYQYI